MRSANSHAASQGSEPLADTMTTRVCPNAESSRPGAVVKSNKSRAEVRRGLVWCCTRPPQSEYNARSPGYRAHHQPAQEVQPDLIFRPRHATRTHMNTYHRWFRFTAVFAVLVGCSSANAAPFVRLEVSAMVVEVVDNQNILGGQVSVGDTLSGIGQYDTQLVDSDNDASIGSYDGVDISKNFLQGTNNASGFFETTDFFDIRVENNFNGHDTVVLWASGDTTPSTLIVDGIDYVDLVITLEDEQGTVFADDSLPTTFDLSSFEKAELVLSGENGFSQQVLYSVTASITSINVTSVPEPSSFCILATLFVGILKPRLNSRLKTHKFRLTD
ncbi:hypothetical protein Mal65_54650 [Crateriforma conspicua]|nr:hypothetical protein Mal65_54650 [Crateriforma conspicua]